jgi:hypothetical protein
MTFTYKRVLASAAKVDISCSPFVFPLKPLEKPADFQVKKCDVEQQTSTWSQVLLDQCSPRFSNTLDNFLSVASQNSKFEPNAIKEEEDDFEYPPNQLALPRRIILD